MPTDDYDGLVRESFVRIAVVTANSYDVPSVDGADMLRAVAARLIEEAREMENGDE